MNYTSHINNNNKYHKASDYVVKLSKRGSTFITHTEHTTIFNTVHIIAAVIGIIGAFLVGIAIFIACRKKRRKKKDIENNRSSQMAQVENGVNNDLSRFSQFANDYETNSQTELIKQPKSIFLLPEQQQHDNDLSPQQRRLQLLYQQLSMSSLNDASSSAAAPLTPPPPYRP